MSLTRKDVENIAHLARLAITDAEMPEYVDRLSKILNLVEQLDAADTASVEPMAHPLKDQVQRMR
uniref:Asp-tRNA(Asn)/Glu-tRNA(Gln) amidotransferase subunit GatC n=1 Tax=Povalibacter sp. TaxID=1962978 RepID=UPI002C1DBC96